MPVEFPLLHVTINHRELPGIHEDSDTDIYLFIFPQRSWLFYSNSTLKDLPMAGVVILKREDSSFTQIQPHEAFVQDLIS